MILNEQEQLFEGTSCWRVEDGIKTGRLCEAFLWTQSAGVTLMSGEYSQCISLLQIDSRRGYALLIR